MASELIDQQVKPFVDNDIRSDWLTAMQKAMAAVAAAFDTATAALTAEPSAMFEVPGDLGPSSTPSVNRPPAADAGEHRAGGLAEPCSRGSAGCEPDGGCDARISRFAGADRGADACRSHARRGNACDRTRRVGDAGDAHHAHDALAR